MINLSKVQKEPVYNIGEYTDLETNTIYLRNRNYSPATGRFLTEDPAQAGLNYYTYCSNNPIMYIDPTGCINYLTQSPFLLYGYGEKANSIGNSFTNPGGNLIEGISSSIAFYQTMGQFYDMMKAGNTQEIKDSLLSMATEATVGDILYMIENYEMFNPNVEISNQQAVELGQRTAGAIFQAEQIGFTLYSLGSAAVTAGKSLQGIKGLEKGLSSVDDIISSPQSLYGKSKGDVLKILGDGWTEGAYGSKKTGWKFTKGDQSIFYHPGGGRHVGSYYGYSSASTGKIKVVGSDYKPLPGDKATIINVKK